MLLAIRVAVGTSTMGVLLGTAVAVCTGVLGGVIVGAGVHDAIRVAVGTGVMGVGVFTGVFIGVGEMNAIAVGVLTGVLIGVGVASSGHSNARIRSNESVPALFIMSANRVDAG